MQQRLAQQAVCEAGADILPIGKTTHDPADPIDSEDNQVKKKKVLKRSTIHSEAR